MGDETNPPAATSDGGTAGALGQPCYGNATCNNPLSCISGFCVDLDSGNHPDTSTNLNDSSAPIDASVDAGCPVCDPVANSCNFPQAGVACSYTKSSGYCFAAASACYTNDACDEFQFTCRSDNDCSSAKCCAPLAGVGASCGGALPFTNPVTLCETTCGTDYPVCASDADCEKKRLSLALHSHGRQ